MATATDYLLAVADALGDVRAEIAALRAELAAARADLTRWSATCAAHDGQLASIAAAQTSEVEARRELRAGAAGALRAAIGSRWAGLVVALAIGWAAAQLGLDIPPLPPLPPIPIGAAEPGPILEALP